MNTRHITNLADAVALAAQIVFDYDHWSSEHCYEMIQSYEYNEEIPPCDYDDLHSLCNYVQKYKDKGRDYHVCIEMVINDLED